MYPKLFIFPHCVQISKHQTPLRDPGQYLVLSIIVNLRKPNEIEFLCYIKFSLNDLTVNMYSLFLYASSLRQHFHFHKQFLSNMHILVVHSDNLIDP